jgi:alkaline phosphatase D
VGEPDAFAPACPRFARQPKPPFTAQAGPAGLARDSVAANRQLKWCDTSQRGYMAVELTPRSATSEWRFMASIRQKGTALAGTRRMTVLAGQRRYESS